MTLTALDHVNIRTSHLDALVAFYRDVLGMHTGWRPAFSFNGAWMYCGDHAVVHLVEVDAQPEVGQPQLEHFAFRAEGLSAFLARLEAQQWEFRQRTVPSNGNQQIFLRDPDGNHIEIQFAASESHP